MKKNLSKRDLSCQLIQPEFQKIDSATRTSSENISTFLGDSSESIEFENDAFSEYEFWEWFPEASIQEDEWEANWVQWQR